LIESFKEEEICMNYHVKNNLLNITVSSRGGELQSVSDKNGTEYLWQGDEAYWGDRAPNLFPYVGRLTQGKLKVDNQVYAMNIHGFLGTTELKIESLKENRMVLRLDADEKTKEQYPYDFTYRICYKLTERTLFITYQVDNHGTKDMFFGIGGHPGFRIPLEEELRFEDYYLEFTDPCNPIRIGFSKECLLSGEDVEYPLENGALIRLRHSLFDDDAIVLKDMSKEVVLKSNQGNRIVKVSYPEMKYLGIWHRPKTEAPYLCIEPWSSLPSRQGIIENLETQPSLISLPFGKKYYNHWSITFD
jgi:galactose mutarotase-like enzyme